MLSMARSAKAEQRRRQRFLDMRQEATESLLAFVRMFWHVVEPQTPFVEGWVLESMCRALEAVTDGHITRLIINVPPGSMKSMLLNIFWPAWEWGPNGMPYLRYLSASYSTSIPERDNARLMRIVSDPVYRTCWGHQFEVTRSGLTLIENSRTGWKRVTSVGGGTTGHRADRILIDDANDPNTVESEAVRSATTHWLREVMPDRLNNQTTSAIVNIQQRTHQDDATGTLVRHGGGSYTWMCIPMEFDPLRIGRCVLRRFEDDAVEDEWIDQRCLDQDGRMLEGLYRDDRDILRVRMGSPMAQAEGMLAWPARFSADAVAELKRMKGPYAWEGQYQQAPTVRGGAIIRRDWWQYWSGDGYPPLGTVIASLDTAQSERETADYNAITVWGAFEGPAGEPQVLLLDAWHARLSMAELVTRVAETCFQRRVDYLLIEDKTRGHDVAAEIQRQYATATWETVLINFSRGPRTQDKVARLHAVAPLFSGDVRKDPMTKMDVWTGGMVWAPDRAWAEEVIDEVTQFPRGSHDDYVDTVSQAFAWMRKNGLVLRKVEHDAFEIERKTFRRSPTIPYAM